MTNQSRARQENIRKEIWNRKFHESPQRSEKYVFYLLEETFEVILVVEVILGVEEVLVVEAAVDGCVEAAVDGCVEAAVDGCVEAAVDGWVEAAVDGSVEAAVDGCVEAAVDGWVEADVLWIVSVGEVVWLVNDMELLFTLLLFILSFKNWKK